MTPVLYHHKNKLTIDWLVTLVADKLKRQWLCIVYFANCKTREEASQIML